MTEAETVMADGDTLPVVVGETGPLTLGATAAMLPSGSSCQARAA